MKKIMIVTGNTGRCIKLAQGLSANNLNEILWADSLESARITASAKLDLIVIDERLNGRSNLDIAMDMIRINAMAHLTLVSDLPPEEFHVVSEGLGVLGSIPPNPGEKDGKKLLDALDALDSLI